MENKSAKLSVNTVSVTLGWSNLILYFWNYINTHTGGFQACSVKQCAQTIEKLWNNAALKFTFCASEYLKMAKMQREWKLDFN